MYDLCRSWRQMTGLKYSQNTWESHPREEAGNISVDVHSLNTIWMDWVQSNVPWNFRLLPSRLSWTLFECHWLSLYPRKTLWLAGVALYVSHQLPLRTFSGPFLFESLKTACETWTFVRKWARFPLDIFRDERKYIRAWCLPLIVTRSGNIKMKRFIMIELELILHSRISSFSFLLAIILCYHVLVAAFPAHFGDSSMQGPTRTLAGRQGL